MLILRRKEGQWVELTHRSGDTIRLRVYNIRARHPGQVDIAFDDVARNFAIQRPERADKLAEGALTEKPAVAVTSDFGFSPEAIPADGSTHRLWETGPLASIAKPS